MSKDLKYLGAPDPLTASCDGAAAVAQRIAALLFARKGPLRRHAGDAYSALVGAAASEDTLLEVARIGLAEILPAINKGRDDRVSAKVVGTGRAGDRLSLSVAITLEGAAPAVVDISI